LPPTRSVTLNLPELIPEAGLPLTREANLAYNNNVKLRQSLSNSVRVGVNKQITGLNYSTSHEDVCENRITSQCILTLTLAGSHLSAHP